MSFALHQSKTTAPRAGALTALPVKTATLLLAAAIASCSDTSRTTAPASARSARKASPSVGNAAALAASTVSFDVAIRMSSSGSPPQALSWHIDRVHAGVAGWRTTVTVPDDPRLSRIPSAPWRPARFLVDENGHLTVYRADGGVATLLDPSKEPIASLVAGGSLPRPSSGAKPPLTLHTQWLDGIVTTSSARAQEVAAAVNGGSAPTRDGSGLDHYAKNVGANRVDFGIDPVAAVVATLNVSGPSGRHQVAHNYVSDPSGNSVRWRTQIEDSGARLMRSTTIVLSNIVIDGHEVQP